MPDFSGFKVETARGMHVIITRNEDKKPMYEQDVNVFFCGIHEVFDDADNGGELFFAADATGKEATIALYNLFSGVRRLIEDGKVPERVVQFCAMGGGGFGLEIQAPFEHKK